jgi:SulP family sulfate permease
MKLPGLQSSGYRPNILAIDLLLGSINGVNDILWGSTFASMIFAGALVSYLPLAVMVLMINAAVIAIIIAVTSECTINVAGSTEQAVAIIAVIAFMMNSRIGEFSGVDSMAATMFVIMALTTLLFGVCLLLAARFNLALVIQLTPFPVICGFLAGTGWLFFSGAIATLTNVEVDITHISQLLSLDNLARWLPAFICGLAVTGILRVKHHFLTLPLSLLVCCAGFYAFAYAMGIPLDALRDGGWVFKLAQAGGTKGIGDLIAGGVNYRFTVSVLPNILTIVLVCMLSTSVAFSALELGTGGSLNINHELRSHATANILSSLGFGLPGITDVAASVMYQKLGASSRLPGLITGLICLLAAFVGGGFIAYLPKLVVGTLVFLAAINLINDWLLTACRQMNRGDALTVWLIFGVIAATNFLNGILLGIMLTSLMFILRYRRIEIVGSSHLLNQLSSSVERSSAESAFIKEFGKSVQIFNLRGFIFFGSANSFFERIKSLCQEKTGLQFFIFNFKRVLGIDSTTAQVFVKLINLLASKEITPVFCAFNNEVAEAFRISGIFEETDPLIINDLDSALTLVEERLLAEQSNDIAQKNLQGILMGILRDPAKAERMSQMMRCRELKKGEYLFHQGDTETTLYVIESGAMEVRLEPQSGKIIRLREFRSGTVVGEMAAYTNNQSRTASAVALEKTVVYGLELAALKAMGEQGREYELILHEFIARFLCARIFFFDSRLQADL